MVNDVIHDGFQFHKVKDSIFVYWSVWVFLWYILGLLGQISMSRKWGTQFSKVWIVNFLILVEAVKFIENDINALIPMASSYLI